jgi:hypothetical protein
MLYPLSYEGLPLPRRAGPIVRLVVPGHPAGTGPRVSLVLLAAVRTAVIGPAAMTLFVPNPDYVW